LERLFEEIMEHDLDEISEDIGVEPPDAPDVPGGDDRDDSASEHDDAEIRAVGVPVVPVVPVEGGGGDRVRPVVRLNADIVAAVRGVVVEGRALLYNASQLATDAAGVLANASISLVSRIVGSDDDREADVLFVQWTQASELRGKRLSLDFQDRIKRVISVPETTFDNCTVHVANVPVFLNRIGERPLMPDWCLLIQRREHARMHSGPRAPSDTHFCVVCSCVERAASDGGYVRSGWGNLLWRCKDCLTFWHGGCVQVLVLDAPLPPLDGSSFVCPVCDAQ
jgi:hypothetical protein